MIRALRDSLRRPDVRRVVGFVVLMAFVLVVLVGAAHAGDRHTDAGNHCGVCDAVAAIGTSESFAAPQLTSHVFETDAVAERDAPAVLAVSPRRSHAPRAPPALA